MCRLMRSGSEGSFQPSALSFQRARPCSNLRRFPRDSLRRRSGVSAPMLAPSACIAYNICMQYTIRNVPDYLDAALRGSAREKGKSLNEAAIEALARGVGLSGRRNRQRDLGDVVGSWIEDPPFERALAEQDTVDKEMWPSLRNPRKRSRKKAAPSIPARQKRARVRAAA